MKPTTLTELYERSITLKDMLEEMLDNGTPIAPGTIKEAYYKIGEVKGLLYGERRRLN